MVQLEDGSRSLLTEVLADDEARLQELIKENPSLLPIEELGMTGPLMVVGRETILPSGAVDLIGISKDGDLLIIEFKTGPQNSDFRQVLAQLLDYGSDLWRMSYEEFESTVAIRYFSSTRNQDVRIQGKDGLDAAACVIWPNLSEEEIDLFRVRLTQQLDSGAFHYVVVAQRFTPTMERTVEYLNATMSSASFYAVELVRFTAEDISAFESRTVLKPKPRTLNSRQATFINEPQLLEQIASDDYRRVLQELLEVCRGLGLHFNWGSAGTSIRLLTSDRAKRVSVAWLFPPGVSGWMGLVNLTLGFDTTVDQTPLLAAALQEYVGRVAALPGVTPAKPAWLNGYHLDPTTTIRHRHKIVEIFATLVQQVNVGKP